MPIGPLEIAIVVVVLLIFFGYRRLPALGRSAGRGIRQLKGSAEEMIGDKVDPSTIGKTAGKGVREAREFRDALTGKTGQEPAREGKAAQEPAGEGRAAEEPARGGTAAGPGGEGEPDRPARADRGDEAEAPSERSG